jgi:hypothetical protein
VATTVSKDEEQIKNEAIKELEKIGEETAQLLKELKEKITPENQEPVVALASSDALASTDALASANASAAGGSKAEIKRRKKTFYRKFNSKKSMKRKNKTNRNK